MRSLSDPRSIITPDAFSVSEELLGTPLAPPVRRFIAILVDLLLIFLISRSGWLLLGLAASAFFFRVATQSKVQQRMTRALRLLLGCSGLIILTATAVTWWAVRVLSGPGTVEKIAEAESVAEEVLAGDRTGGARGLLNFVGGAAAAAGFMSAETVEEAQVAGSELARRALQAGLAESEIEGLLHELAPAEAAWRENAISHIMGSLVPDTVVPQDEPALPSLEESLEQYASLLRSGDSASLASPAASRLRSRIGDAMSHDSLAALHREVASLRRANEQNQDELDDTREELEELREGSRFIRFVGDMADEIGITSLWGALYMAFFLAWWSGRTPGKRLTGIRVILLDGKSLSWWMAFERAGGYAAGLATGLLGFAQVFWDPNRQAIHDKIAGTVVVLDGAAPLPGLWSTTATRPQGAEGPQGPHASRRGASAAQGRGEGQKTSEEVSRRSSSDSGGGNG